MDEDALVCRPWWRRRRGLLTWIGYVHSGWSDFRALNPDPRADFDAPKSPDLPDLPDLDDGLHRVHPLFAEAFERAGQELFHLDEDRLDEVYEHLGVGALSVIGVLEIAQQEAVAVARERFVDACGESADDYDYRLHEAERTVHVCAYGAPFRYRIDPDLKHALYYYAVDRDGLALTDQGALARALDLYLETLATV